MAELQRRRQFILKEVSTNRIKTLFFLEKLFRKHISLKMLWYV